MSDPTPSRQEAFLRKAGAPRTGLARELYGLLRDNKKWWLAPIVVAMLLLGVLVMLGGGAAAPFIYTLF